MPSPLEWLGGHEQDHVLKTLAGMWQDDQGSTYYLLENRGASLDVLTVRPSGHRIFTKSLIRSSHGSGAVWGTSAKAFVLHLDGDRLQWRRGEKRFNWRKIQ